MSDIKRDILVRLMWQEALMNIDASESVRQDEDVNA